MGALFALVPLDVFFVQMSRDSVEFEQPRRPSFIRTVFALVPRVRMVHVCVVLQRRIVFGLVRTLVTLVPLNILLV